MTYLNNLFDLKNRVAVITGGGGVLAGKMAEGLVLSGVKVVLLDLDLGKAKKTAGTLAGKGEISAMKCDVLDKDDLREIKNLLKDKFGFIDILINAAGGNMPGATIAPGNSLFDMDMDDFNRVNALNLNGTVLPSLVLGKLMIKKERGSIINLSSMAADRIITRVVGYSASKAAVTNFTKWMAVEMAQKFGEGIRVNALAPGFFIGNQNRRLLTKKDGSLTDRGKVIVRNTPMGRFGEADELIGAVLYLGSDASKFVTGVVLPVDGGFSAFSGV